ncbi:MAG: tRNA (pseudouridine(54)-N(1))-methyltransferase TrmY [archaeon]|nr:tRNA (pseudouridine(54)-N(1))-methyltransferase TrmY [archaeon]
MRYFVITGHKASSDGAFKLDDLAGGAGRLDILVRCVNSAFVKSHDLRKDAEIYLVCEGGDDAPKTVRINGASVRYLNPDERSTASLIRNALLKKIPEGGEANSSPGVYVSRMSFDDVIEKLAPLGNFVYLKEDGVDCRDFEFPEDPIFVLGDNHDLTEAEETKLLSKEPSKISVGPISLHADHCMILVQNELDRRLAAKGEQI